MLKTKAGERKKEKHSCPVEKCVFGRDTIASESLKKKTSREGLEDSTELDDRRLKVKESYIVLIVVFRVCQLVSGF